MLHLIQSTWGKDLSETFINCNTCNASHDNLSVCSGCYIASFCNTNCQIDHNCLIGNDISVLSKDIFATLSKWLNLEDLGNLRLVSTEFNRKLREQFFRNITVDFDIRKYDIWDHQIDPIVPFIKKVKISDLDDLIVLQQKGAKLTHVTFSENFNEEVTTYGWYFDGKLFTGLPETLTHLTFGKKFDRDIRNGLPRNLKHLTFGTVNGSSRFNQPVKNGLPKGLTHLTFGNDFDQDVKDGLPDSLTHLIFGNYFKQDVKDSLPKGLTHLTFGYYFNKDIHSGLPKTLTYLKFGTAFNHDIRKGLPENLTHLTFEGFFNQEVINGLPTHLTHLTFGPSFNQDVHGGLPKTLKHLRFGYKFNQDVRGGLPEGLTHLIFNVGFKQHIANGLPKTLKYLQVSFDYPFKDELPEFTKISSFDLTRK